MNDILSHLGFKLKRADEHIKQLKREIRVFLKKTKNRQLVYKDPQIAKSFERAQQQRRVPARLSIITGEVIYQLRSTLDHLICALILRDGGTPTEKSQFPIFRFKPNPTKKDEVRRYEGQIEGIKRPEVLAIIESHQPYLRGDRRNGHWLAILKDFSNTDKHRALILHRVHAERRIRMMADLGDGMTLESDTLDRAENSTEPTFEDVDIAGEVITKADVVRIMHMQRRVASRVTFAKWGSTGQILDVDEALRALLQGVSSIVTELAPFL